MINVAMLSAWHVHAKGYAREISSDPGCKITAVWDELPERGKQWADEIGCRFFDNCDDIFGNGEIDAVVINAPTNIHAELMIKAARAGKHIFTEKVLTLTTEYAKRVRDAVIESGVHFTISFPQKCRNSLLYAKKLAQSGKLGTLTYARIRNCHSGSVDNWLPEHFYNREQCGGGAMIDLGAHPMYLLNWLLGKPLSVRSLFTNVTPRPVEDNAVCLVEFEGGAIGVSETGFVSRCDRFTLDISGTDGAVCIVGDTVDYCSVIETNKKWISADVEDYKMMSPLSYWIDSIKNNTKNELFGIDEAVVLTQMMDAAYRSYESGAAAEITC